MPLYDTRTIDTTRKGKRATAGRRSVLYRDAKGNTKAARVLSEGTNSGLKLSIGSNNCAVVDDVAAATTRTQTNVYYSRLQ